MQKRATSSITQLYLWLGFKTVSDTSSTAISIILATYAFEVTGSATLLGVAMALRLLGSVAGGAVVPRLSRLSRRTIIFSGEVGSGLAIGTLAISTRSADALLIYLVPFLIGFFQGIYRVAIMSEIPEMVGQHGRHRFNAILSATDGMSVVAGSLIASVITKYLSFKSVFLVDAITFGISAVSFLALVSSMPRQAAEAPQAQSHSSATQAVRLARYIPTLMALVIVARFVEAFGSGTHNVGFPIRSQLFDKDHPVFLYGWIMAAWGVGRLVSAALVPRMLGDLERRNKSLEMLFILLLIVTFLCFMGVFQVQALSLMLSLASLAGIFDAATETTYYSVLQSSQTNVRERVISTSYVAERGGLGLGMLVVGFAFSRMGTAATALVFYGVSIALAGLTLEAVRKHLTRRVTV